MGKILNVYLNIWLNIIAPNSEFLKMEKKCKNILKKILKFRSVTLKKSEEIGTEIHCCKLKQIKISQDCSKGHLLPVSLREQGQLPTTNQWRNLLSVLMNLKNFMQNMNSKTNSKTTLES